MNDYRVVFLKNEYIIALSGPETGRKFRNSPEGREATGGDFESIEQYVVIEGGCFPYEAFDTKEEALECVKSLEEHALLLEGRSVCPTCGQNTKSHGGDEEVQAHAQRDQLQRRALWIQRLEKPELRLASGQTRLTWCQLLQKVHPKQEFAICPVSLESGAAYSSKRQAL